MKSIVFFVIIVKLSSLVKAEGSTCDAVPFSQWADSPLKRKEILPGPLSIVVIQHTATGECSSDEECERIIKSIRTAHIGRGFSDIGPSFLIGGNGKVYEGAGWKHVGAHTLGYNQRAIGITFIGNFSERLPSSSAQTALSKFLQCGVEHKYLTDGYHMVAHNQLSKTDSPGQMLRKQIEQWPHWLDHAKEKLN